MVTAIRDRTDKAGMWARFLNRGKDLGGGQYMATTTTANSFLQRLVGAAALDAAIYEEVEADVSATGQALIVVLISSLAAAVGVRGFAGETGVNVAVLSVAGLLSWACWALLTYEIGVRFMPEPQTRGSVGENLRTIGFSA